MIANDVAHMLAKALAPRQRQDAPEVTSGTVTRTDTDGTVWVRLFGADDDTPCTGSTAAAKPGDVVTVTIDGGSARVDGNVTAPATDDARADEAVRMTERVAEDAGAAMEAAQAAGGVASQAVADAKAAASVASEAAEVADAINQHFFADTSGVHVTEATQEDWDTSPTGRNVLVNSLGILLRTGLNNLASVTQGAIAFYDGLGNAASNLLAQFGTAGATIYASGAKVADFGASGMAVGSFTNLGTLWRGASVTPTGIALGTIGGTTGQFPAASSYSIAAGGSSQTVTRSGGGATVTGFECSATDHSIAVGTGARATGSGSAAFGDAVSATGDNQLVIGRYNEADATKALVIGNGVMDDGETGTVRSNAFSVGWDGTLYCDVPVPVSSGGTGQTSLQATRNAMGLGNTTGELPIANGGTGSTGVSKTTTASSIIEAATGFTLGSVSYAEWGKVAQLSVQVKGFAASSGSQTAGTVVSGKRPVYAVYATAITSANAPYASLDTDGTLSVYWSSAPGTTTNYVIRFVYLLA